MHQSDDIIGRGKFQFAGGRLSVPRGPGLGVALEESRFHRYAELHRRECHLGSVGDPRRPDFVPSRGMW